MKYSILAFDKSVQAGIPFKVESDRPLSDRQAVELACATDPLAKDMLSRPETDISVFDITDTSETALSRFIDRRLPPDVNLRRIAYVYDRYTAMRNTELIGINHDFAYSLLFGE